MKSILFATFFIILNACSTSNGVQTFSKNSNLIDVMDQQAQELRSELDLDQDQYYTLQKLYDELSNDINSVLETPLPKKDEMDQAKTLWNQTNDELKDVFSYNQYQKYENLKSDVYKKLTETIEP